MKSSVSRPGLALCLALTLPGVAGAEMALYGQALVALEAVDTRNYPGPDPDVPLAVNGNRSWLGFRGEEALREDLGLVWRGEVYLDLDGGGWGEGRELWLALRHRLGTVSLGRQSSPYRWAGETLDVFADTRGDYHAVVGSIDGEAVFGNRWQRQVRYQTPVLKRFQLSLGATPDYGAADGEDHWGYSAALVFDSGPLYLGVAYAQLKDFVSKLAPYTGTPDGSAVARKLALGWDFGQGTKLGFVFEDAVNGARRNGKEVGRRAYYLGFSRVMGNTTLRLAGAYLDDLAGVDDSAATFAAVGFSYAFSPRVDLFAQAAWVGNGQGSAYGLMADSDDPAPLRPASGEDMGVLSLGLRYSFDRPI